MERFPVASVDFGSLPSHSQAGLCSAHPALRGCELQDQICSLCSTRCTAFHCCACSRLEIQLWRAALFTQIQTWTLSNTALQCKGRAGDQCTYRKQMGRLSLCLRCSRAQWGLARKTNKILPGRVICRCSASLAPIMSIINTRSGEFDWRSLSGFIEKSKFHGFFHSSACGMWSKIWAKAMQPTKGSVSLCLAFVFTQDSHLYCYF